MERKQYKTVDFLKSLKSNTVLANILPVGYTAGYPILEERNDTLCITVPFLRYKVTGEVDQTRVYPIRYVATFTLPDTKLIELVDLKYTAPFVNVYFDRPCGLFRHDSIKSLDRQQYKMARLQLLSEYDHYIAAALDKDNEDYTAEEFNAFRAHLQRLLEPSLKPFYQILCGEFYDDFLK